MSLNVHNYLCLCSGVVRIRQDAFDLTVDQIVNLIEDRNEERIYFLPFH